MAANAADAADIVSLDVKRPDSIYQVSLDAMVDGDPDAIVKLITDYDNWPLLNTSVVEVHATRSSSVGPDTIRSVTRACILFLCRKITQTQLINRSGPFIIEARTVPRESDFSYGFIRWQIEPRGMRSRVRIVAHITPAFWIPPVIGPYAVKHVLAREIAETLIALEQRLPGVTPAED